MLLRPDNPQQIVAHDTRRRMEDRVPPKWRNEYAGKRSGPGRLGLEGEIATTPTRPDIEPITSGTKQL